MNDRRGYRSSNFDSRYGRDEGFGEREGREGYEDRGRFGRYEEGRFRGGYGDEERFGRGRHDEGLWDRMRGEAREGWESLSGRDEERYADMRDPNRFHRYGGSFQGRGGSGYGSGMSGYGSGMYGSGMYGSGMYGSGMYGSGMYGGYGEGQGYYGNQGYQGRGREDLWGGRDRSGRHEERGFWDRAREEMREGWEAVKETFAGKGPKGYKRSDDRIREDVCDRLTRHAGVDASDIEVSVREGEVTLTGATGDRRQKRLAEDIVEDIDGVRDVQNQLRVKRTHTEIGRETTSQLGSRDNGVVTTGSNVGRGGANATR